MDLYQKAKKMVKKFCLGNSKYINKEAIINDVEKLLNEMVVSLTEENVDRRDMLHKYTYKIQDILFVLKPQYMKSGDLSRKIDEHDLMLMDELKKISKCI